MQPSDLASDDEVLIVDDEARGRDLLARALTRAGFACRQCADGAQALAEVARRRPALLLLDFSMPGMDGTEVCAALRAHADPQVAQMPIIMMTGMTGQEQEIRCLELGANDFVSKPVNVAVLRARIQTHLRLSLLRQQLERRNAELADWRARLERDLEAARRTQQALIPPRPPVLEGWDVSAHYRPLIQVGGDVYDWQPLPDGRWFFWMADATGHGAAAALLTALTKLVFSYGTASSSSPAEVLGQINRDLHHVFAGRSLLTAMALTLDPRTGELHVAGAGHPPLLVGRADGSLEEIYSQTPPLGILELPPAGPVSETVVTLGPGDFWLLFTDGLYGQHAGEGKTPLDFTQMRNFVAELTAAATAPAAPDGRAADPAALLLERLLGRIRQFGGEEGRRTDDVAAVVGYRRG